MAVYEYVFSLKLGEIFIPSIFNEESFKLLSTSSVLVTFSALSFVTVVFSMVFVVPAVALVRYSVTFPPFESVTTILFSPSTKFTSTVLPLSFTLM